MYTVQLDSPLLACRLYKPDKDVRVIACAMKQRYYPQSGYAFRWLRTWQKFRHHNIHYAGPPGAPAPSILPECISASVMTYLPPTAPRVADFSPDSSESQPHRPLSLALPQASGKGHN